jgi:hypothetical protein
MKGKGSAAGSVLALFFVLISASSWSQSIVTLTNGQTVPNLAAAAGNQTFYVINVPYGQTSLEIKISGGSGDCDLYVKRGSPPTMSSYSYRPYLGGNNEAVTVTNPASGNWYIMLQAYNSYSGVSLRATYVATQELFDDFTYSSVSRLIANNWTIRTGTGGPGVSGAYWSASLISLVTDPQNVANKLLRLGASTNGMKSGTLQSQINRTAYKYREGTYAARVFFRDAPSSGSPDGDKIVQTFYAICQYDQYAGSYNYSELDFEYLPNGGWERSGNTMWMTSWEIVTPDIHMSTPKGGSFTGWHTLVIQVSGAGIKYYIDVDTSPFATHPSYYYPEVPMTVSFNLWFIDLTTGSPPTTRAYYQDVDWVFYAKGVTLYPSQVQAKVNGFRAAGIAYKDTVQ